MRPAFAPVNIPAEWTVSEDSHGDQALGHAGESLELNMLRRYEPGDAVRRVDWRASARAGDLVVRQFITLNDLADDGKRNGSLKQSPRKKSGQVDGGHAFTMTSYRYRGRPLIEYYQVEKMGHAWSGGKDDLLFSDGKGPDASQFMWDFFKQFSR